MEANNVDEVITILENNSIQLFKWFSDNKMKANKDKCHLLISSNEEVSIKIGNIELQELKNTSSEKLLGITIDSKNWQLIVYAKDVCVLSVIIINHHFKNY